MSLGVVLNAAEPIKSGVTKVATTATHHGINPSEYLSSVSRTRYSLIGRACNMSFCLALPDLLDYFLDTVLYFVTIELLPKTVNSTL